MPREAPPPAGLPALLLAALLAGCATARPPAPAPVAVTRAVSPTPPAAAQPASTPAPPAPAAVAAPAPTPTAADAVLAFADRVRTLPPPELAQEIQRLGDTPYAPERALQLALALAQSRTPANASRAQALLQRVLAQTDAETAALHPLARLMAAQLAELRRADEQVERQAQLTREAQRRIEVLNDRLEAVRAIERSVPSRPATEVPRGGASAPRAPGR